MWANNYWCIPIIAQIFANFWLWLNNIFSVDLSRRLRLIAINYNVWFGLLLVDVHHHLTLQTVSEFLIPCILSVLEGSVCYVQFLHKLIKWFIIISNFIELCIGRLSTNFQFLFCQSFL